MTTARCQDILTDVAVIAASGLPSDPLDALREITRSETELDRLRRDCIRAARTAGATWDQIGAALGVTRQSAWEHYSREPWATATARATANGAIASEDDTLDVAVNEVKAVRRHRRAH